MTRRVLLSLLVVMLLAVAVPARMTLADSTAADCADGQWEVRPNQTLGFIAYTCGTTVNALVAYNNLVNPNLINTGEIILLPPGDFTPGTSPSAPAAPNNPPAAPAPTGAVTVVWGTPLYAGDGKVVDIPLTVTNNSVTPAIAGGRYKLGHGVGTPDGPLWITLLGAIQSEIPYPYVTANEPLWHATVYTDDGLVAPAFVGCKYIETVYSVGDEPLSRADNIWFHWEVTLPGGWFDCGNQYQAKPEDIKPGETGASVLTVYLVNPRSDATVGTRRVVRVDLELFTTEGQSLGIVSSQTFK